jgi:hypothetical protein
MQRSTPSSRRGRGPVLSASYNEEFRAGYVTALEVTLRLFMELFNSHDTVTTCILFERQLRETLQILQTGTCEPQ